MELEELKNKWQKLNIRVERLEKDNKRMASELAAGRAATARKSLVRYYNVSAFNGMLLPLLAPMLVMVLHFQLWVACLYAVFGMVMSVLNFVFADYIRRNADMTLPVVDALNNLLVIRRRQKQLRILGIVCGIIVVSSMFGQVTGQGDKYVMLGMLIGLCVGIPMGVFKELRSRRLLRTMQRELQACLDEDME